MNKRILFALSCLLLVGITLLTIASTYTSSDSAHRFNGTIYATDSSLAGTALFPQPAPLTSLHVPLTYGTGNKYGLSSLQSVFAGTNDNAGSWGYNLSQTAGDVYAALALESCYNNLPTGIDTEFMFAWKGPTAVNRRIFQCNISDGPSWGAPTDEGYTTWGFGVQKFLVGTNVLDTDLIIDFTPVAGPSMWWKHDMSLSGYLTMDRGIQFNGGGQMTNAVANGPFSAGQITVSSNLFAGPTGATGYPFTVTNGLVGIGHSTPLSKLDVWGGFITIQQGQSINMSSSTHTALGGIITPYTDHILYIDMPDGSSSEIVFRPNSQERLRLSNAAPGVKVSTTVAEPVTGGGDVNLGVTHHAYLLSEDGKTATLPAAGATTKGIEYIIKVITPATSGTVAGVIDGVTNYSLTASNKFIRVLCDGTNWWNIGSN